MYPAYCPVHVLKTLCKASIQEQRFYPQQQQCWLMQRQVVKVVDDAVSEINPLYEQPVLGCGTAHSASLLPACLPPYYSSQSRSRHLHHHHGGGELFQNPDEDAAASLWDGEYKGAEFFICYLHKVQILRNWFSLGEKLQDAGCRLFEDLASKAFLEWKGAQGPGGRKLDTDHIDHPDEEWQNSGRLRSGDRLGALWQPLILLLILLLHYW